jgi:hypothetical protein
MLIFSIVVFILIIYNQVECKIKSILSKGKEYNYANKNTVTSIESDIKKCKDYQDLKNCRLCIESNQDLINPFIINGLKFKLLVKERSIFLKTKGEFFIS